MPAATTSPTTTTTALPVSAGIPCHSATATATHATEYAACPDGNDDPLASTSIPLGRGRSTTALAMWTATTVSTAPLTSAPASSGRCMATSATAVATMSHARNP